MNTYLVATIKLWNIKMFKEKIRHYPGHWHLITDPQKLTVEQIKKIMPRYIFFPHWSWLVPEPILHLAECICFHETDLPYGRGGSPIQNLIVHGHQHTVISAIRMEKGLDTGPIYLKRKLNLHGSAQEIFERTARITAAMIKTITSKEPTPQPQTGAPTIFKRRAPEQSDLASLPSPTLKQVYDLIRMLDAATYPKAFLATDHLRLEFSQAKKLKDKVVAKTVITKI